MRVTSLTQMKSQTHVSPERYVRDVSWAVVSSGYVIDYTIYQGNTGELVRDLMLLRSISVAS